MIRALALALAALLLVAAQEQTPRLVVQDPHHDEVIAVAIAADASLAASLDASGAVRVWVLPTGQLYLSLPPLKPRPSGLSLDEGVLFVRAGGRVRAWDLHGGFEVELPPDFTPPEAAQAREASAGGLSLRVEGAELALLSEAGEALGRLGGEALAPVAVDWGPGGPRALYAEGSLLQWTSAGAPLRLHVDAPAPRDFAVTADGLGLLVGDAEGPARLVDAGTGAELHRFVGHTGHLRVAAADPEQRRALTGSAKGDVIAWDLSSQSALRALPPHEGPVSALAWGPGELALSGGMDGDARLVRVDTGEVLALRHAHRGGVRALAFSPDGRSWVSGDGEGSLRSWSVEGTPRFTVKGPGPVGALAWLPDGSAFVASRGAELQLYRAEDGAALRLIEGPQAEVRQLLVHQGGARLLAGDAEGGLQAWDLATGELLWQVQAHESPISFLAADDGEGRVYTGSAKGGVRSWRAESGRAEGQGPTRAVAAGSLSADGQRLVLGRSAGGLGVWQPEGWVFLGRLEGDAEGAPAVATSPDGELVLTGGEAGYLRSWHLRSGSMISRVRHGRAISTVAVSADGEWAASGDVDGGVLLWAVDQAADVRELDGVGVSVTALRFSADGAALWIGDARGRVHHQPLDGGARESWATHRGPVRGLALSPDGQRLASVGEDGLVQLWTGPEAGEGRRVSRAVFDLAWSPDGQRLLLAETDRLEVLNVDHLALRCTLVSGPSAWQLVDTDGGHSGAGEAPLVQLIEEGSVRTLGGAGERSAWTACLGP